MEHLAGQADLLVMDCLSPAVSRMKPTDTLPFFSACQSICTGGTPIVIALDSYCLDPDLMGRYHSLFDTHLRMSAQAFDRGAQIWPNYVIEALKVLGVEVSRQNTAVFRIDPAISEHGSLSVMPYVAFNP